MNEKESFLTETQTKVLKLKSKGLSQSEIAEKLDTSRSNICSLEKRAKQNIQRAEKTLDLAEKIQSPISVKIHVDEDILDAAKRLFSKADEAEIHVNSDTPEIMSKIRNKAEDKLEGRRAIEEIKLSLSSDGEVNVYT